VRSGKGDAYREVPLNSACRKAIDEWAEARSDQLAALADAGDPRAGTDALWLSRAGDRMSARAIDLVVRRLASDAKLELSAHTLRHTALTNLEMSDVPFDASFGTVRDQGAAREIGHDAVGVGA
jgi:site-specific recombinase XerD